MNSLIFSGSSVHISRMQKRYIYVDGTKEDLAVGVLCSMATALGYLCINNNTLVVFKRGGRKFCSSGLESS